MGRNPIKAKAMKRQTEKIIKKFNNVVFLIPGTGSHRRRIYIESKATVIVDFWGKMDAH